MFYLPYALVILMLTAPAAFAEDADYTPPSREEIVEQIEDIRDERQERILTEELEKEAAEVESPLAETDESYEESIPEAVKEIDADFWTFTIENDKFGDGKDQNYTNGARLTYYDYGADIPDFIKRIDKFVPFFAVNETTSVYYSLGQNMFTPEDTARRNPDPGDRPYAGFLYGAAGLTSVKDNHIDEMELTLGVVGPAALGEEVQKAVHRVIDVQDPKGWSYQLKNEPAVMVSVQRQWPEALSGELAGFNMSAAPHAGATVGNVYTYAAGGLTLQLTPKQYKWQSRPPRVRPAIPGSGFFAVPEDHFAWTLFAGVESRVMGRNIFLDGNSFTNSRSVEKERYVADANAGVSVTYGRTQISYTANWRSKEFEGQDENSIFGVVSLGYRF